MNPLFILPEDNEIIKPHLKIVKIQMNVVHLNSDFETLTLSDFLDIIRLLVKYILSENRSSINKKAGLGMYFCFKCCSGFCEYIENILGVKRKIPP